MRVLFVAPKPPPIHGSAVVSKMAFELLESNGFAVNWVNSGSNQVLKKYNSFGVSKLFSGFWNMVRTIGKLNWFNNWVYFTPALNGLAFWRDMAVLLVLLVLNPNARFVLHMHNKGREKNKLKRLIFSFVTKRLTIIVLGQKLAKPYKSKNVKVIHNYVIKEIENDSKFLRRNSVINIGYFSNYIKSKGISDFIEIAKLLKVSKHRLWTAGNDADCTIEDIRNWRDEFDIKNLTVLSGVHNIAKWKYLSSLDILLFPSSYENECSPLVILEAIISNTVVIAYDEGGISDMYPESSLCLVDSIDEMIGVLMRLLNDATLYNHEKQIQFDHVNRNFNKAGFERRFLEVFK